VETTYSDWKNVINADNRKEMIYCPKCQRPVAYLTHRHATDRNGERFEQFRVVCGGCGDTGKTYQNQIVAILSWNGQEQTPPATQRYFTSARRSGRM